MKLHHLFFFVFAFTVACQHDAANGDSSKLSPEETLYQYQRFVDNNQFAEAATLSTAAEQERLQMLELILSQEDPDSSILHTRFLSTDCVVGKDTAICSCQMKDEYEQYQQDFQLIKQDGKWLIDAPQEETIIEDEVIEEMLESLDTMLRESPPRNPEAEE